MYLAVEADSRREVTYWMLPASRTCAMGGVPTPQGYTEHTRWRGGIPEMYLQRCCEIPATGQAAGSQQELLRGLGCLLLVHDAVGAVSPYDHRNNRWLGRLRQPAFLHVWGLRQVPYRLVCRPAEYTPPW